MPTLIEACVDSIDSAIEAELGGADRVELCGELLQGGVTPSAGLVGGVCERIKIPVFALIRPRPGDFLYDDDELDVMLRDIEVIRSLSVEGIAIGALTRDGDIDIGTMYTLIAAAGDMNVTFHRAFDFVRDQRVALEGLIELGVDRVLTSGGAPTALEGADVLAELVDQGGSDITILAGGGINATNAAEVVRRSGVQEVHVRGAAAVKSEMTYQPPDITLVRPKPPADYERMGTRAIEMRRIVATLRDGGPVSLG